MHFLIMISEYYNYEKVFILGLLICTNSMAASHTSFEEEYHSHLEKFYGSSTKRYFYKKECE